jgi:hypothetical protein
MNMIDQRVSLLVGVQVAVKRQTYTNRLHMMLDIHNNVNAKLHALVFAHTWVRVGSQVKNSLAEQN